MIVDPDFLDHWKTQMLIDMLEDQCAPLYLIRLWGHCQNRKEWIFNGLPVHGVKAICRYQGDAEKLENALIQCGFLERECDQVTVVGWEERNATLIANWENGSKGGRPKGSRSRTDRKPTGSDRDNPSGTDKSRVDESGVDKPPKSPKGDDVPYQDVVDLYHELLPELPKCLKLTEPRKRLIRARWKDKASVPDEHGQPVEVKCNDLDFWRRYFNFVRGSPFLMGQTDAGFRANLDFLLKPQKMVNTLEGFYDNGKR